MIRLFEIKLKIGENEDCLNEAVFKKLGADHGTMITDMRISGRSIDARNKKDIRYVYNIDFTLDSKSEITEEQFLSKVIKKNKKLKIRIVDDNIYDPKRKDVDHIKRPVVAGFGPAGMFAGFALAVNGLNPIILERGKSVDERVKDVADFWEEGIFDPDSNPLFGEGGAGTFSDGKLTTGKNDRRIPYILKEFHNAGADEDILYAKNPHIGTDVLRTVVKNIRNKIIDLGGEVRFSTTLTQINSANGQLDSVTVQTKDGLETIQTNDMILATGHSARDTYKALLEQGLKMEQKPFSIGIRIEHDQNLIDKSQYGGDFEQIYGMSLKEAGMPPAEYKLSHRLEDGRGVYTFCMCPGGQIITTSAEEGTISVNGMSNRKRDGNKANSAVLVDVKTEDYDSFEPLSGIEFQREYERRAFAAGGMYYSAPTETVKEFMSCESRISGCLPEFAAQGIKEALSVFGRKIRGFDNDDAVIKGIESGSSSPVRIIRDKNLMGSIEGVYPCGEGAGHAGGITSAAIDGLKCAEAIMDNKQNDGA